MFLSLIRACRNLTSEPFRAGIRPCNSLPVKGEKKRINGYNCRHGSRTLRRIIYGFRGNRHTAHVQAESLYEAVALAVAEFRRGLDGAAALPQQPSSLSPSSGRLIEHRIRLNQVTKWAESTTREGPAGITKREKVKDPAWATCALVRIQIPSPSPRPATTTSRATSDAYRSFTLLLDFKNVKGA